MHILFLNTLYPPHGAAGAETTLRLLAATLQKRGHRCTVVTLTPGATAESGEVDGNAVHYLPLANVYFPHGGPRPRLLRPAFQAIEAYNPVMRRRLETLLRTLRPDVMSAHNLQGFSASAWVAARRAGVPVVQTLHDYYAACPRSTMWRPESGNCAVPCAECRVFSAPRRALSHIPAAVTCVSNRVFDRLTAAGAFGRARDGKQPVHIIRGNNAAAEAPPRPVPPPGSGLRLGFMGRLDPSKGVERLIDAVRALPPGSATLAIAGSGPPEYVASLRDRAEGAAGIAFLGHVDPAGFLGAIDLLVIPSVWEDPFPRVFHEALAHGVPSLVGRLGGVQEMVRDGQTGFLFDGTDAGLADSLTRLSTTPWDRAALDGACREAARAYAPDRIAAEYEAVFQAAAARRVAEAGVRWAPPPLAGRGARP